jgi:hypothetical protein
MFLRWTRYRDKQGGVRLYARLLTCHREGRRIRQRSITSLRVSISAGVEWPAEERRDMWRHLDYVLERHRPSPAERANIERVFAAEVGERPPPSALVRAWAEVGPMLMEPTDP